MELRLSGCICNRLERRYLEPPMARNPSWLPDAQCARRAAAGSVLSQIDMSFGDTPLLLNRRRRGTPVGETASCRGIALPNLRPVRSTMFLPGARWRFAVHRGLAPLESPCVRLYRERGGRPSTAHGWVAFLCEAGMVMGPHCIFLGQVVLLRNRIKDACGAGRTPPRAHWRVGLPHRGLRAPLRDQTHY